MALSTGCVEGRPDAAVDAFWVAPALARTELCNNGIDDDQNGLIDEGCLCAIGATQTCYEGWPATAGIGICTLGRQRCEARGSTGTWGLCVGSIQPLVDACNGLDDNCNGRVDEDCECTEEGITQPCFTGSARAQGVGACAAGVQTCEYDPAHSLDGARAFAWGSCLGSVGPRDESCNTVDDDCDGVVDNIVEVCDLTDNDCDAAIDEGDVCAALPAARTLTRYWSSVGGSGVFPPSAPLYTFVETAPVACPPDEILLEVSLGVSECVPLPPVCEDRRRPVFIDGLWQCVPCDVLVQFGYLFAYERVCAPVPTITCADGEVPTFLEDVRAWRCVNTCSNTDYDRAFYEGELICVPC